MTEEKRRRHPRKRSAKGKAHSKPKSRRTTSRPHFKPKPMTLAMDEVLGAIAKRANDALAAHINTDAELAKQSNERGGKLSPQDSYVNRFKVAIYQGVREQFARGRHKLMKGLAERHDDGRKTISFERNPYNWILLALQRDKALKKVWKDDELVDPLTPNLINSLGWQLQHAHNHDIEPELLVGFLHQTSASSLWKQKLIKADGPVYYERWYAAYRARAKRIR